ncbi:MAG: PD-(D/E)XK nuclease family protein, partial [Rhodospirillaceae bacterium]
ALTRAEDRLYICGWQGSAKPVDGNWYQILENALKGFETIIDLSELSSEGWRGTGYRLKNPQKGIVDEIRKQDNVIDNEEARPPPWAFNSPPAEKAAEADLTPSGFDDESLVVSPIASSDRGRFERGLIIHKLLQVLPGVSKERQERAARNFVSQPVHGLSLVQQSQIVSEVIRVLNDPRFAELFSRGSRGEVPLIGKVGDITISGQVDRLAVTSTRVLVVDYKSNRPPPNDLHLVPAAYLRQMSAYRFLVRKIWPNRMIECGILWTIGPTLMKLSDDLLDNWEPG